MGFSAGSGPQAPQRTHPACKHLASRLSSIDHEDHEGGQNRVPKEVLPGPLKRLGATRRLPPWPAAPSRSATRGLAQTWLRGRPCPIAGRSRSPSMDSALSVPPALSPSGLRLPARPALGARATPRCSAKRCAAGALASAQASAGIGERLRSDEVLRGTTKLLPAPPTNHPPARGPLGWLKRCFWIASAASSTTHSGYSPGTER